MEAGNSKYKWYLLGLILVTNVTLLAMPSMAMSVLSSEISKDLNLNVVQIGIIWGIGSLPAIFTSLFGGSLGDKFGPKKMMVISTFLVGLLGALRGLAPNYAMLLVSVVLLGAFMPFVFLNGVKTIGQWFPNSQLGLANGVVTMAMALGFFLGSILSASVLAPWLGGWKPVFIFYGLIGAFMCIPWFFTRSAPLTVTATGQSISMGKSIAHVVRVKNIWMIGLVMFCMSGAIQGVMGYLPLFLRGAGWEGIKADSALSAYNLVSMVFVLPIALMSDRLRSRKKIMIIGGITAILGFALIGIAQGNWVWAVVLFSGFMRDGFMSMLFTSVIETEGIGPLYAGTAMGFINSIGGIGMSLEPALGNSLAAGWSGAPFMLWAGSALAAVILVLFLKGKSKKRIETLQMEPAAA